MLYRYELLREARDRKLLTNARIAKLIDRSESVVSKTLSGARSGRETLRLIANVLGVPEKKLYVQPKRKPNERRTA